MSEKCPCCGEDLKFGDKISGFYPTVDCKKCGFPRNPHMRERIAAAMELAKKLSKIHELGHKRPTSDRDKYNERVIAMSEALEDYQSAKERVLEVFNECCEAIHNG